MTEQTIRPGQVYAACHPLDEGHRIRVTAYTPGHTHAQIADADTGRRLRRIQVRRLDQDTTAGNGAVRCTGYARETAQ